MKLKRKRPIVLAALLIFGIIAVSICWFALFKRESITVLNSNPYPVVVAVRYQSAPGTWQTLGWIPLGPGERETLTAIFFRVKPEFFVTAESRDQKLLRWLTESGDGVVYFAGNDIKGQLPKNRDINLAEVETPDVELEEVAFARVNPDEDIHILADLLFQDAVLQNDGAEVGDEEEGFALIREKASHLYESLQRQQRFEETFKSESDYPFAFEFTMTDDPERGFMYLGVTISDVGSHTLHGDEIQLRDGDVLVGIGPGGEKPVTPVYSPADAYLALHEHALDTENGGIAKPLQFLVTRNKELLQVESYYLFNPAFNWGDVSAVRAFFEGGINSITLGFWPWLKGQFSDDPAESWKTSQRLGRLRQFHPRATTAGEIVGLVAPVPTKVLTLGKVAWGGRLLGSTVVRGIGVEILRMAVYTYNTSVPTPQTTPFSDDQLCKLFASTTPPNVLEGFYTNTVEPTLKQRHAFGQSH